ncbi:MAG: tRNA uridine-5-carboxymethylaminomethyl(34) synthesis enzyme MnmG [Bacteroidaceae bacterium]|nr:tRNA uridine-5-carboxymethylaminomethyl(34) synthesis enzyme MnmG [Bacteroidaceae bacterium]
MEFSYDVIVVGAGHAGCEAACAAANLGAKTCLITMDMNKIAQMSCNPAVGGIAKGQIVREIDALGGQMGLVTDRASIQFRMLNRSKGPAMWSPRAQCDREKFIWTWRNVLDQTKNLSIWQDQVRSLIYEPADNQGETGSKTGKILVGENPSEKTGIAQKVVGVCTYTDTVLHAKCVIITAGTFLNGLMHIGRTKLPGGRCAEPASLELTESITSTGIRQGRMKTGTPVRIDKRSVDFSLMEEQPGDEIGGGFSYIGERNNLKQLPCWIVYTNEEVHEMLRSGFADSPLYNGQIQSIGPRYCPSIETKLHTFPDKQQHMLFLEPEGTDTNEMYLNGFSSSLPIDVQIKALKRIPAFRNLEVYRPGYAIEYDYFDPTQLKHSLESKVVENLFFAGQVNGTTGYEEAAGQGLIAGVNAAINSSKNTENILNGGEPFVLQRNEAYIGVLIDDLVTKGVDEPYRMFTSRAEYRILLRQDDADMRLTEKSYRLGLATEERYERTEKKRNDIEALIEFCNNFSLKPALINEALETLGTTPLTQGIKLSDLLGRPQISFENITEHIRPLKKAIDSIMPDASDEYRREVVEAAEIRIKYAGYIGREQQAAEKMMRLENIKIAGKFDYPNLSQISIEARQKLQAIQPVTLGQASRIPGVSPSDINIMLVLMGR